MTITLRHVSRSFGSTRAVQEASLHVAAGEIVGIVGENGAGKTTLMRIAAREMAPDSGEVESVGNVALVHQHFLLVNELTVAENLALAAGPRFRFATRRTVEREAGEVVARSGVAVGDVGRRVADLSVGEKAKLELVKAISTAPATLILDEPTSVLTPQEAHELFGVMRELARRGTAVVLISHKLPEVLAVAQRIVVMRAGRIVTETAASETSLEQLARAMVAAPREQRERESGNGHPRERTSVLQEGPLNLRAREIAAVVGVAGNGQSELAARLRDQLPEAAHIPEDRTRDGIIAGMSIAENLALRSAAAWNRRAAVRRAEEMIALYAIRASGPHQKAGELSGGNQQKVILARELERQPAIVVAAEPTRGLDLESTRFVHERLRDAAAAGAAILVITSDLDEAFGLADTIHVINRGRLSEGMTPPEAAARVATLMAGAV